jgi:hypothetical protein
VNRLPHNGILGPPKKGLLLPDGTPASKDYAPGQAAAAWLVGTAAKMPSFHGELDNIAAWRERKGEKHELDAGQRLTIKLVQMAARWQVEALDIINKARGTLPQEGSGDDGHGDS